MDEARRVDFSPKEFMKQRRPERFSDSVVIESGLLDRVVLEHFLSSLNVHSKELEFEGFAKRLCEKTICPNLLSQTGPVAGGDGKTDTQTFPVSEQNALLWYEGINDSSHKERWAFAVSTQKKWKEKCRKDVIKVKENLRDYKKVFCITNQFCKADQRVALETTLTEESGMGVRILDLNWIMDQVFTKKLQYLVIENLSLQTSSKSEIIAGENDYKKRKKYNHINSKIEVEINLDKITHSEVELFLEMAVLSAELENPQHETYGLFSRAIKVAKKFGTIQQKIDCYYQFAWKSHFWLEDIDSFEDNVKLVFETIKDSTKSSQWESLINLIMVYKTHLRLNPIKEAIDIVSIEKAMVDKLTEISSDDSIPSNALLAKTHLLIWDLQNKKINKSEDDIFIDLLDVIKKSLSLVGYPFEKLFNLINELDSIYNDNKYYEELLDFITEQYSLRDGEIRGAELLLKRGIKRLSSSKPYEAIRIIGKTLIPLYKKESADIFIVAMRVCSFAYESVGLLWGARGCMLFAASMLTDKFWDKEELSIHQYKTYNQLSWLELKLGRLGYALKWLELATLIKTQLSIDYESKDDENKDAFITQLVLNTAFEKLTELENIPYVLDFYGFYSSSITLMYVLGYEEKLNEEYKIESNSDLINHFVNFRDFDFGVRNNGIIDQLGKRVSYLTNISGCRIRINFPNKSPFFDFSTSLLASLEGIFATSMLDNLFTKESSLEIDVTSDDDEFSISHEIDKKSSQLKVDIICSDFNQKNYSINNQEEFHEWNKRLMLDLLPILFFIPNLDSLEKSIFIDGALSRSSTLAVTFFASRNCLGSNVDTDVRKLYLEKRDNISFPLARTQSWDVDISKENTESSIAKMKFGEGPIPPELNNRDSLRHDDYVIQELINSRLWDPAGWSGVIYLRGVNSTPGICLSFDEKEKGRVIFSDLISKVGINDENGKIIIKIIRGVSAENPAHYTVVISEDSVLSNHKIISLISRNLTLTPNSTENIDQFIDSYNEAGKCYFSCDAMLDDLRKSTPSFGILVKKIIVKWAWQIGSNDPEISCLDLERKPYIPDNTLNAPVIKALEKLKSLRSK